jgi:hypothetical protein
MLAPVFEFQRTQIMCVMAVFVKMVGRGRGSLSCSWQYLWQPFANSLWV